MGCRSSATVTEMISFIKLVLLFSPCLSLVKQFDDLQSEEEKKNFDSYPLISRTVTEIQSCEVRFYDGGEI